MTKTRYDTYNEKCEFFCIRLRKEEDKKYIDFLKTCPNRVEFIRQAIDKSMQE